MLNDADSLSDAALDRLLSKLPPQDVPPGLAERIIAEITRLPQHKLRESVITLSPPRPRRLGQQAFRQRMAGLSAIAAAACLLMVFWPIGMRERAIPSTTPRTAGASPLPDAKATQQQPTKLAKPLQREAIRPDRESTSAKIGRARDAAQDVSVEPRLPLSPPQEPADRQVPSAAPHAADSAQLAEVAGPKTPVQGPPTPIGLVSASGATMGLGVVGGPGTGSIPGPR